MDKTQKEKIREKFRKDYYQTGKLTYIEEDGTERADSGKIIDWWLNELDLAIKETEERVVREIENALPKYPPNSEREELAQKQMLEILTNFIRNK